MTNELREELEEKDIEELRAMAQANGLSITGVTREGLIILLLELANKELTEEGKLGGGDV